MRRRPEIRAGRNDPPRPNGIGEWRSPVARLLWEQDVAGSNPVSPTILFTTHVPQISAPTVRACTQVIIPPANGYGRDPHVASAIGFVSNAKGSAHKNGPRCTLRAGAGDAKRLVVEYW